MKPDDLKKLRKKLGLTATQAAEQVHVSYRTWARWEAGTRHMPDAALHLFMALNGMKWKDDNSP